MDEVKLPIDNGQDGRDHGQPRAPKRRALEAGVGPPVRRAPAEAVPNGLSHHGRLERHALAWRPKAPRDEIFKWHADTGSVGLADGVTSFVEHNIPVQPWDITSKFWDWNECCLPLTWHPTDIFEAAARDLAQCKLHYSLVPKCDNEAAPSWSGLLQQVTANNLGTGSLGLDYDQLRFHEMVYRLPVTGLYYHMDMQFQGQIRVGSGVNNTMATIDGRVPHLRFLAFQLVEDDSTNEIGNQLNLSYFYRHLPNMALDQYPPLPPEATKRLNSMDKDKWFSDTGYVVPKYKILLDKTVPVTRPDGTVLKIIPFNLNFGTQVRRYELEDAEREEATNAKLPDVPLPYRTAAKPGVASNAPGRIVWQVFHNIRGVAPGGDPVRRQLPSELLFQWCGRWSFQVRDGNF